MAILPVRVLPDPLLRKKARRVKAIDAAIQKLAADMIETMQAASGVGLAANQVGVLRRVVTLQMPDDAPWAMINPEITRREGGRRVEEGCLSVPGWLGMVTRSVSINACALGLDSRELKFDASELLAQAIEHEIDHLNGILFIDHLAKHEDLWKSDEEPPVHEHADVDFEHEASHDRVVRPGERSLAYPDGRDGERAGPGGDGLATPEAVLELALSSETRLGEALEEARRRLARH